MFHFSQKGVVKESFMRLNQSTLNSKYIIKVCVNIMNSANWKNILGTTFGTDSKFVFLEETNGPI